VLSAPSFFMSSHHIVREDQEPALIIANGESCSPELLGQLLEWSPLVVVLDSAVHRVLDLGIKIDVLLGDFDRDLDLAAIAERQYPLEVVHRPDQDKTDLEKAFDFLVQRGHRGVNVVWATGRRADHAISNMTNLVRYRHTLQIVVWDDFSKLFLLPYHYQKWYPAGTPLSLIPVGTVSGISTQNLKYPLQNESLVLGYRSGNSNEVREDGLVEIRYERGDLLLMECHD
jgi:thiamine pyrophosphokinase